MNTWIQKIKKWFVKEINVPALVLIMFQYLDQTTLNVYVNTLIQSMIQLQENALKGNVDAIRDFKVHGHVLVELNMEIIKQLLRQDRKDNNKERQLTI